MSDVVSDRSLGDAASAPAADRLSNAARLGVLALCGALILARLPQAVLHPRFFEEEGQYFFAYAWHMPAWKALWHSFGGYLNLPANAATLAAVGLVRSGALSLENAPVLTETVGLLAQLCPTILLLWGRADWLRPRWAAPAAAVFSVLAPASEEVWLQSLHIQFHLGLAAAVMLATDADVRPGLRAFRLALLALAPLSGPPGVILLPLFAARALMDRTAARGLEFAILALGAGVQIGFFAGGTESRMLTMTPALLVNTILVRQYLVPLAGAPVSNALGETLRALYFAGSWIFYAVALLGATALVALARTAARRPRHGASWLFAAAMLTAAAAYIGGIELAPDYLQVLHAERYSYMPNALLPVALVALLPSVEGPLARGLFRLLLWMAVLSLVGLTVPVETFARGPDWRAEVATFRLDPAYRPRSWPAGRPVDLSPDAPLCSADRADPDPADYCPRHWELHDNHPSPQRRAGR